jgi:hypothetical protein
MITKNQRLITIRKKARNSKALFVLYEGTTYGVRHPTLEYTAFLSEIKPFRQKIPLVYFVNYS